MRLSLPLPELLDLAAKGAVGVATTLEAIRSITRDITRRCAGAHELVLTAPQELVSGLSTATSHQAAAVEPSRYAGFAC